MPALIWTVAVRLPPLASIAAFAAAVPAEAYDPSLSLRTRKLVPPGLGGVSDELLDGELACAVQGRPGRRPKASRLAGRFANVLEKAVNFYTNLEPK